MGSYLGAALQGPLLSILPNHEGLTALRARPCEIPSLGFEEHRTSALVAERLKSFGVDEVHTGIAKTGVVAIIRGRGNGLRAITACRHGRARDERGKRVRASFDPRRADARLRPRRPLIRLLAAARARPRRATSTAPPC